METITEKQALQNFATNLGLIVYEYYFQDKRKSNKYFLSANGISVSPVFDYENLNSFMIGWSRFNQFNNLKNETL